MARAHEARKLWLSRSLCELERWWAAASLVDCNLLSLWDHTVVGVIGALYGLDLTCSDRAERLRYTGVLLISVESMVMFQWGGRSRRRQTKHKASYTASRKMRNVSRRRRRPCYRHSATDCQPATSVWHRHALPNYKRYDLIEYQTKAVLSTCILTPACIRWPCSDLHLWPSDHWLHACLPSDSLPSSVLIAQAVLMLVVFYRRLHVHDAT